MKLLLRNVRLFFQGAYLSYVALFHWLRPAQYLATKVVNPLWQIMFFTLMGIYGSGGESASFYIVGNALVQTALNGIFGVTFSITGERWTGTLPYLFGTPANRLTLFVGRSLIHILDGMLGVLIGLTWGVLLLNLDLSQADPISLLTVILITSFSTAGLGLALGSLSLVTRNVMFVNNTAFFGLLILSGANIAIDKLPLIIQRISYALPLTRGISSARAVVNGTPLSELLSVMGTELLIGGLYATVGYFLFILFERQAKKLGTLEVF
jgi:ABC-2 type transport system permease protein